MSVSVRDVNLDSGERDEADPAELGVDGKELYEHLRRVLVEIFYNELSIQEAAEVLGIPAGTVKSRKYYALRALGATTALPSPGGE
jgi:RNA polymerase sigma-70 factor, ECF subfamily